MHEHHHIVSMIVMQEVDKKRPLMTPHAPTCLRLPDCGRGLFEPLSPSSHVFIMVVVHDDRDDDEDNNEDVSNICYQTKTEATFTSLTLDECVGF